MAAVATAVASGFDEEKTADALALAMSGTSGRAGRPGGSPSGRWYLLGDAVSKGIRAALAASNGVAGDRALLSDEWLETQTAPQLVRPEALRRLPADAIGETGLKPYVCARQGANAIKGFIDLLDDGLDPAEIRAIEVALPPVAVPVVSRPLNLQERLSTIANLGLQFGIAAWERDRLLDIGRDAAFDRRSLDLAGRVSVVADGNLVAPESPRTWPASITVRTGSNDAIDARSMSCPGDAGDPASRSVVRGKFERFCGDDGRKTIEEWNEGKWAAFLETGLGRLDDGFASMPEAASG
jgi:2-methylcitrate dehydratase PrpD